MAKSLFISKVIFSLLILLIVYFCSGCAVHYNYEVELVNVEKSNKEQDGINEKINQAINSVNHWHRSFVNSWKRIKRMKI